MYTWIIIGLLQFFILYLLMAKADIEKQFNTISYEHKELNEKFNSLYRQIESRASSLKEEWVINEKITIEKIYDDKATNELNKWKTENENVSEMMPLKEAVRF